MTRCDQSEQAIIDFLLQRLDNREEEKLVRHLQGCGYCQSRCRYWKGILQQDMKARPRPHLKWRLARHVAVRRIESIFFGFLRQSSFWSAVFALFIFVFLVGSVFSIKHFNTLPRHDHGGSQRGMLHPLESVPLILENGLSAGQPADFLIRPETVEYTIHAQRPQKVKGYVWLNSNTQDLFLVVEGLKLSDREDYQAWLVQNQILYNGGLLSRNQGGKKLYFHGRAVKLADHLSISLEPKGGSSMPTGPRIVFLDLKNK